MLTSIASGIKQLFDSFPNVLMSHNDRRLHITHSASMTLVDVDKAADKCLSVIDSDLVTSEMLSSNLSQLSPAG